MIKRIGYLPLLLLVLMSFASVFYIPQNSIQFKDYSPSVGKNRLEIHPPQSAAELFVFSYRQFAIPQSDGRREEADIIRLPVSATSDTVLNFRLHYLENPSDIMLLTIFTCEPLDSIQLNATPSLTNRRLSFIQWRAFQYRDNDSDTLFLPEEYSSRQLIEIKQGKDEAVVHVLQKSSRFVQYILSDHLSNNSTVLLHTGEDIFPQWLERIDLKFAYLVNLKPRNSNYCYAGTGKGKINLFLPLGANLNGKDVMGVILLGFRTALYILILTTLLTIPIGVTLGMYAGFQDSWISRAIQLAMSVFSILPRIILIVFIARVTHDNLWVILLSLALLSWPEAARSIMNQTRILRSQEYIVAAVTIGASLPRLILRHLMPNLQRLIVVLLLEAATTAVILESTLTFLNVVSSQQQQPRSWGYLLSNAENLLGASLSSTSAFNVWQIIAPVLAIIFVIGTFSLALRQVRSELL